MISPTSSRIPTPTASIELPTAWDAILFDLDGTVVDSASDIMASLAHMYVELDLPTPSLEVLRDYVGPPLLDSLKLVAGLTDEEAQTALRIYRAHYEPRAHLAPVFPGVAGLLERLHTAGIPLAIATSKPERMARSILEHANLTQYFTAIAGASDDEKLSAKADIVELALARLRESDVSTEHTIMVGDRGYDVVGAAANDVPTILVEWGYGSPEEAGDAVAVVHSTDQLARLLLR